MSKIINLNNEEIQFVFDTFKSIYQSIVYDKLSDEQKIIFNKLKKEIED